MQRRSCVRYGKACRLITTLLIACAVPGDSINSEARAQNQNVTVEQVDIRGNRRIPESIIRVWIGTREGEAYSPKQLDQDVRTLFAQGHFRDVKVYAEDGERGGKVVTFQVAERPLLLDIKYEGLKSVPLSALLEEMRKRGVALSKQS